MERPLEDPELEAFLADVVDGVEHEIDTDGAIPDLAAVVALAHRLDPERVSATAVDEVGTYAPVVSLKRGRRLRQTRDDPDLEAIVAQVRAHVEQEVVQTLHGATSRPTPPPAPISIAGRRRRSLASRGWLVGLAAAVVLALLGIGVLEATRLTRGDDPTSAEAALSDRADAEDTPRTARERTPAPRVEPAPPTEAEAPAIEDEAPAIEDAPAERAPVATRKRARRASARPTPAESLDDRLQRLDAEADAAWRAGDRKTARAKYETIVREGGQRRIADLAFGDLFTLARQAGDAGAEVALWRKYLQRFPDGRFADDARAGLCRRAPEDARAECWRDYLQRMPRGAYRAQARRELARLGEGDR